MMEKQAITFKQLRQMVLKITRSGLEEITWKKPDAVIRIRCYPQLPAIDPVPAAIAPPEQATVLLPVSAAYPGRLLLSHPDNGIPFVRVGDPVSAGDMLALVQVGALYLPLCSPVSAVLESVHYEEGSALEYGSDVFLLLPDDKQEARL